MRSVSRRCSICMHAAVARLHGDFACTPAPPCHATCSQTKRHFCQPLLLCGVLSALPLHTGSAGLGGAPALRWRPGWQTSPTCCWQKGSSTCYSIECCCRVARSLGRRPTHCRRWAGLLGVMGRLVVRGVKREVEQGHAAGRWTGGEAAPCEVTPFRFTYSAHAHLQTCAAAWSPSPHTHCNASLICPPLPLPAPTGPGRQRHCPG